MHIPTHLMSGWCIASLFDLTLRERLLCMLAASAEIPNPGDYKTIEAVGVPILIVRGKDGVVRAFINSCVHRGANVATAERGKARTGRTTRCWTG